MRTAVDPIVRFWRNVDLSDPLNCWVWKGALNAGGYGRLGFADQTQVAAHRFSYELEKGPIPKGLTIDHLCRNRACVRPDHLEAVSQRENLARGINHRRAMTHCKHGHEFTAANTYRDRRGLRQCRTCTRERQRAKRLSID